MNLLDAKRKLLPLSGYMAGGGGGDSGGGSHQTTSTSYQTNIPEYARPYVETMLGATQKQLFQGTPTEGGGFDITGYQPYKAYGGTYDEQGNQIAYDPSKGIAGFQPLQTRAQQGIANMQVPGQYGQAIDTTGAGIQGALGTAGQGVNLAGMGYETAGAGNRYAMMATNPYAMQSYMSPYMQNVVDIQQREAQRQADIAATGRNAQATQAGAFGGTRQAIMDAEAARNLATQKGDIQAQGLQNAFQQAQQAQQFGAGLGLQGMQAGMAGIGAGIGAQQAGYGQMMSGAQNLAGLGQQELASQQGIYNLQNTVGAQQQALEQQKLNQALQDYANAQQYPLMQLGTMSNMIRGLPMQASTSNQYVAAPNTLTQAIGAAGTGASLYNAFNPPAKAAGGIISYDVGGEVQSDLENASDEFLERQIKESSSPSVKRMAQRIRRERQMSKEGPGMAGGGIVAFAKGDVVPPIEDEDTRRAQGILMASPRPRGEVTANPTQPPKPVALPQQAVVPTPSPPTLGEAIQSATDLTPAMKAAQKQYADEAATSVEDRLAKIREAKAAAGIEAPGVEQMSRLMAERANAEDEAMRNRYLRAAEFFATWGTTPGTTLLAGMEAVKAKVPSIISDEKESKKIRMEIDKSIATLEEATRLEKKGEFDAATAEKQKAAEMSKSLNLEIIKIQEEEAKGIRVDKRTEAKDIRAEKRAEEKDIRAGKREMERIMAQLTSNEKINQLKIDSDTAIAKMNADWHKAEKANWNTSKLLGLLGQAQSHADNVENQISNTMKSTDYGDAVEKMNLYKNKTSQNEMALYDAAKKKVEAYEKNFSTMRNGAQNQLRVMSEQLGVTPQGAGGGRGAPPPPAGARLD